MKLNLSLNQRFSALLFMFVGMTAVVFYMLVVAKNEPIDFGTQEIYGNVYQKPLEKVLYGIMQHRVVAQRALNGDKQSAAKLTSIQTNVNVALTELTGVDQELAETLQFTDKGLSMRKREHYRVSNVVKEWNDLTGKVNNLKAAESNELHAHLIGDVRTMITHAGDTSNLILDPDLDSYYLMDITLLALPQTQERIQNVIIELEGIVRRGHITNEDRIKASVFASMMNESDLVRITGDHQTILNEDPNFYGKQDTLETKLTPANASFTKAYQDLINVVNGIANGKLESPERFVQVSDLALKESFDYWHVAVGEMDKFLENRVSTFQKSKTKAAAASLVCLLLSLGVAFGFLRYIVKNLRGILNVLNQSSEEVSGASSQSASSATELSEASAEQAASLQETMATIEQISAMVNQNADSASKTKTAVDANLTVAENGSKSVDEMLGAISEIKLTNEKILEQMETSNKEFGEIVKIIAEIGQKTNVINEIVFQTKLLSFNASVEAARAGEHGKGFAVVAEEVGNLAQMSGNAAKEITDMLSSSIKKVNTIVENTKTRVDQLVEIGRDKIVMGQSTAEKCHGSLRKITENAHAVAGMISEITKASKEQAQGIQEITKAFSQLDQVTQQNSSVAQQSSIQAEQLNTESQTLSEAVKNLVLFVDGVNELQHTAVHHQNNTSNTQNGNGQHKVIAFNTKTKTGVKGYKTPVAHTGVQYKKVAGSTVPSSSDPNFEEF